MLRRHKLIAPVVCFVLGTPFFCFPRSTMETSQMATSQMEKMKEPKCLVETVDGKLAVNPEALNLLKSLQDKEVVVVAIAGPYRTGKSYLLNKLAGEKKGFALGSTIQSMTKGIWFWTKEHPEKEDKYLVLLDTEGLGDVEKGDENNDNQILCLSVLLASAFVYNVMGVIGNDAIAKLHFIMELSKHMQVKSSSESKTDDSDFDFYFPDFVYAIRDFTLDLEIDGRDVTPDEYLEHCLTMKPGNRPEILNFNNIRKCIRSYFRKRKCFTFVPPIAGKCRKLDEVQDVALQPDFREETKDFVDYVYKESPVKQIKGKKLTGSMFATLVESYVKQMQTGVPYVENAVVTMASVENGRAKDEGVQLYYILMLQNLKMPVLVDADISRCHADCLQKAIDLFLKKAVFDENQIFQKEMNVDIDTKYKELVQMNENICRQKCLDALEEIYSPIQQKVSVGHYTKNGGFRMYKDDMKELEATYREKHGQLAAKIPHVLLEFLHSNSKQTEEYAILSADEQVTAAEKKQEEERQRASEMERQKQEAERANEVQKQMLEDQRRAYEDNIARLEKKIQEDAETTRKYYEVILEKRREDQQRALLEGYMVHSEHMQARIDRLSRQIQESNRNSGSCVIQ